MEVFFDIDALALVGGVVEVLVIFVAAVHIDIVLVAVIVVGAV